MKATSDENKTGPALNEAAGIAETGRTYSDPSKTMTRNLGRPGMMKIEKRSSMTQLLSQIKDKLPGRRNKGIYTLLLIVIFSEFMSVLGLNF